ncbi:MAG: starch-binding protein [Ruminococcus sp.]|nr:starch-binding protein [Ruminococcus sp.]
MQMFKKSVALVLSVLMLLSMLTVAAGMSAFAAETYKVTAKNTQGVFANVSKTYKAGDEFDLNVYLTADQMMSDGQWTVNFDPASLFATSVTCSGPLSGKLVAGGANNERYQTRFNGISINFVCGLDVADYTKSAIFFTVHFKVKDAISADQNIDVDFEFIDGIVDELDLSTQFPYIEKHATVAAQKDHFSMTAELTGGSTEPETQPATQPDTTVAPTTAKPTQAPTTAAPTTKAPDTYTVYFTDALGWGTPNIYYWNGGPAWPGTAMTLDQEDNGFGQKVYKATVPTNIEGIVFNGGGKQTVDIKSDIKDGAQWYPINEKDNQGHYKVELAGGEQATTEAQETTTPVGDKDYYLFGYINGANYACEDDAANMGDYKFVNGKVTATFDQTSYVAVKEDGNANWYMTDGWQGEVNSATLYNTTSLGTDANKLYVPGNVEVEFTLVKNGDGTLTLSYTTKQEPTTAEPTEATTAKPTEAPEPTTLAPEPTTVAPEPTTAAPEQTTAAPEQTTAAPEQTTAAPEQTTAAPEETTVAPTTQAPEMYTFYYLPSAEQEAAGNTYKLNFNDPNGTNPENWHQYTFAQTPIKMNGVNLYSVSVPKDFDDVTVLQYQVYNGSDWVSENKFANVKLSDYNNQVVRSDGTIEPEQPTTVAPEETTVAPEPTTVAPEETTVAPEPTTEAPEPTTVAPEPTTVAPEPTTVAPQPTTVAPQPTTAEPTTVEPTKATQAPTIAPSKVDFNKPVDEASAVNAISKAKSDGDPKGSKFSGLKAKVAKTTKNSNKVTWNKVSGAKKYIVMGNKCGKTNGKFNAFKKLKTTTGKSFTQKGLKKGTYYKYLVLAVNSKGKVISASKVMHVATKGGKVTNYKSLKVKKASFKLKKGKTAKIKITKKVKMAKGKVKNHRKIKYESANTKIATVSASGKIKAKKKGTTYVYAYAQNGVFKKIKVKVK